MMLFFFAVMLAGFQFWGSEAQAQSSYFTSRGCTDCHGAPTVATCNGCHHHGNSNLKAATNKTSYAPGETVTATLSGGSRTGWIRAILYDQNNTQVAVSNGNASGMGGSTTFPAALTASAPATPGTYTWKMAYFGNQDGTGSGDVHSAVTVNTNSFTVATTISPAKIGTFNNGTWFLDVNGNGVWNGTPTDRQLSFGIPGAIPVVGDWNGNGTTGIGAYDKGTWYIDLNDNGVWDGMPTDTNYIFGAGIAGAVPVTGDWTGSGTTRIGVFVNGTWYLDLNGNNAWDGAQIDGVYTFGAGITGAVPVTGDWTGDGTTKIGVYANGTWYLDFNGNKLWDGATTDRQYFFGFAGSIPVTGDWNADGKTEIGTYTNGRWDLDLNGNGAWNGTPTDVFYNFGSGLPVTGKW
jgi:hypothetical protein